ncbi:unnamed protein product [Caenorhabditis angaria]|uniref:BTB domain-containing protein n=1 Tax=Caenorhabditis angaria TaxID=860376 RepID=A0A9P1IWL5_9PELO|nr:unnamed protein product [Caenorhabditis angaria]
MDNEAPCCSNVLNKKSIFEEFEIASGSCDHTVEFRNDEQPIEIMKFMKNFRDDDNLCDVELEIDGDVIRAHRYILAAASPYFRAMFTNGMLEMTKSRIKLNDISKDSMEELIQFIYSNEITIRGSNVQSLLFAASILQMDNIATACQQFLTKTITVQNCIGLHQFAETYNCTHLLSATDNFAVDNFQFIRGRADFSKIPANHLRGLLMRSDLNVNNEAEVFETIIDWITVDVKERERYLPELFDTVRLPLLGWNYLIRIVNQHPLVKQNAICRERVADSLFHTLAPNKQGTSSSNLDIPESGQYGSMTNSTLSIQSPIVSAVTLHKMRPRKSVAGIIFCAGGRGTLGDPFRSVEAYDWRKNQWFSIADMTVQRRHVGVVSALGDLYAIGGHDGVTHLCSAEMFSPAEGVWRRISSMSTARRGIAVATLDAAIYAVGGLDDSTCFKTVERYDIELDKWSTVADMTIQRGGVGVSALGKYLFAIGGNDGTSSLDTCERFDPLLDRWKIIARMQNRRAGAGVAVLDGHLYAIGGFDDNAPLATCEKYDVLSDIWHPIANMNSPRGGVGVASMGGKVYAIGGHDGSRYLNTVESYDPLTNIWTAVADIKECRAGAGVSWADCRVDQLLSARPHFGESGCAPSTGSSQCI